MSHTWYMDNDKCCFTVYSGPKNAATNIKCSRELSMLNVARSVAQRIHGRNHDYTCYANGIVIDMEKTKVDNVYGKFITVVMAPITSSHWYIMNGKCVFSVYTRRGEENIIECSLDDTVDKAVASFVRMLNKPYRLCANWSMINVKTTKVKDIFGMLIFIDF